MLTAFDICWEQIQAVATFNKLLTAQLTTLSAIITRGRSFKIWSKIQLGLVWQLHESVCHFVKSTWVLKTRQIKKIPINSQKEIKGIFFYLTGLQDPCERQCIDQYEPQTAKIWTSYLKDIWLKGKYFFTEMLLLLRALKVTCILTCSSLAHHKENPEEQKKKHHDSVSRSTTQQRLIAWLVWRTDGVTRPRPAFRPQCKLPSAACPLIRLAFTVSAAEHCRQRNGWLDVPMCTIIARNGFHCYCSWALHLMVGLTFSRRPLRKNRRCSPSFKVAAPCFFIGSSRCFCSGALHASQYF